MFLFKFWIFIICYYLEDELVQLDDEPDPEKDVKSKAKDDLNLFSDSDDEEDETELNAAGMIILIY